MRILWVTNHLFECFLPYVKGKPANDGSWIAPLFYNIKNQQGVTLGAITSVIDGEALKKMINDVAYYCIPIEKNENYRNMNKDLASRYLWAINDFKPDIIHVHGTERNYGLLRNYVNTNIPIVCSVQGIISPYYDGLKMSIADIGIGKYRSLKNWFGRGGVNFKLRTWKRYRHVEGEVYRVNDYFIGRTTWDKAYVNIYNPNAVYYHAEELLRPPFYKTRWGIHTCEKNRIFVSSSSYPLKGFHTLIKAVAALKDKYPDIKVVAPLSSMRVNASKWLDLLISEDYGIYLKNEIVRLGLQKNIVLLKRLTAEEMANEYQKAHVFVLPSFMENSPNSLGEAMLIGTPSIATPVGGVMSIVEDESSTLISPSGDYVMMAYQIDRVLSDEKLASRISENARLIAEKRHNIVDATQQYIQIYEGIVNTHKPRL